MNSREAVRRALNHEDPGRVPVDLGSSATSGIHVSCVAALRNHYGLESRPVKVVEPYQMLGEVDAQLRQVLGVDTVMLPGYRTIFGFVNENWKVFRLPWGQVALVSEHFRTSEDANGDLLLYPQGDTGVPPSGRMPASGFFFDTIVRQPRLDEELLDPEDNLEEFAPLAEDELAHLAGQAGLLAGSDRAVVGGTPGTGLGDIALVPAPFLRHPKGIRDVEEWYVSTVTRQDYIHAVFSRQTETALENLPKLRDAVGDAVDVVFVCGTDFGTQTSSFCSTATFDSLYAPYYRQINGWIHAHTSWKTLKHSCGAVEPFLSRFADAGFDIVNPVQCSAARMDPTELKRRHGDRLVFWGGGVDTQRTLPFGTPQDVRKEVLERCEVFAPGGGFVFNPVHNIQALTPVENIVAVFDAVREFNGA